MSINQFTRDAAYFQVMRDRAMMINAEDLDLQFNNLVDYLNAEIVPIINNFIAGAFIGVNDPNLSMACLLNVGDGTTRWQRINSNIFPDYSIPLTKFAPIDPNCVVWAGSNRRFDVNAASNLNDGILFSRNNVSNIWRKVNTGDIADKTLIGGHIGLGAVRIQHLDVSLQAELFAAPRMILNTNIIDPYVREDNLQDNSLLEDKIAIDLIQTRQDSIEVGNYIWLDNSIENRHLQNQVLDGGFGLNGNQYTSLQMRNDPFNDPISYTFTSNNIIDESITDTLIGPTAGYNFTTRQLTEAQFETGAIEPRHIQNYTVTLYKDFYNTDKIPKEALDPKIRAVLGV